MIPVLAVAVGLAVLAAILALNLFRLLIRRLQNLTIAGRLLSLAILELAAISKWDLVKSNFYYELGAITISAVLICNLAYEIYVSIYFKSKRFRRAKDSISQYTNNCNELNGHIESLKSTFVEITAPDFGESTLQDTSNFKMQRLNWQQQEIRNRVYNCSASVCKNAHDQPFKYICKYFNIKSNEHSLSVFEKVLNNFSAAEQGKVLLSNERDNIIYRIRKSIPNLIMRFKRERVIRELGFHGVDLSDLYFPVYTFQYVSAGGNSSFRSDTKLDIQTLDRFIVYLSGLVTFRKSVAGQRALMTSVLREKIKIRDGYTCRICSLSTSNEKNLLLEIDHIVPVSKGGTTTEQNLQTLCWRCNRSKGARLVYSTAVSSDSVD